MYTFQREREKERERERCSSSKKVNIVEEMVVIWLRLSMLKIKRTDLLKNPTRNYEKKRKRKKIRERNKSMFGRIGI